MASRRRSARIEPTFDGPAAGEARSGLFALEDDRIVPSQAKGNRAKAARRPAVGEGARKAKASSGHGSSRTSSRGRKRGKARRGGGGGFFSFMRRSVYWMMVLGLWVGIGGVGLVAFYGARMPAATTWAVPDRPPNVRIVDVNGQLVANRGMTGGEAVGLHEMSPFIPQAVIAIEDRRFHSHFGVDPIGLSRAMVSNVLDRRVSQGGSTLTQQLAKNLFLKPERTIERKVQEVLMAFWLERSFTKDQIIEMYLNRVYFGSGSYGVEAASRRYFGKSARDVSLSEAALLAGLLKAPSRLSPARDPKAAEDRARIVLAAMRDQGMIGDSQLASAISTPAVRAAAYWTGSEHYVADRVMEELPQLVGEVQGDLVVETTVDLVLQTFAEASIRRLIDGEGGKHNVSQGALVSIDASGAVRAMVGGYDYATSQFDRASEARRQPGSAFKPFIYASALERGLTPATQISDEPFVLTAAQTGSREWKPKNYGGQYEPMLTLRQALYRSKNMVSIRIMQAVGPQYVQDYVTRFGFDRERQPPVLPLALGAGSVTPLQLASAYGVFANGGYRIPPYLIDRVTDSDGKVIMQARPTVAGDAKARAIDPRTVYVMNDLLHGVATQGTGARATAALKRRDLAGKTGTTNDSHDAWFAGFTPALVTVAWMGFDQPRSLGATETGGGLALPMWVAYMDVALDNVPESKPGALPPGLHRDAGDFHFDEFPPGEAVARVGLPLATDHMIDEEPEDGIAGLLRQLGIGGPAPLNQPDPVPF